MKSEFRKRRECCVCEKERTNVDVFKRHREDRVYRQLYRSPTDVCEQRCVRIRRGKCFYKEEGAITTTDVKVYYFKCGSQLFTAYFPLFSSSFASHPYPPLFFSSMREVRAFFFGCVNRINILSVNGEIICPSVLKEVNF